MDSPGFHPAIWRWFEHMFGSPTEPQAQGWPSIQSGAHTLIAAPTGSGKTLTAFMAALNALFEEGLHGELPDETRVLYVSPLKALSNDIHKNLEEPLAGVRTALLQDQGLDIGVRAQVRTGDTPSAQRQLMIRKPPHILVTTPESFYLLLTSDSGRKVLRTVRTLIVDEIHALAGNRRGSHLALSMERLEALTGRPVQRIGLSATQKPIELVAEFLCGYTTPNKPRPCHIIDCGYARKLDLAIELPGSPLDAVMSNEVWDEVYDRLAALIQEHRTTLVFVNTRRLAERVTHHLCERLGKEQVTSHHGSLSSKLRLEAEDRLKRGELRALVATASLELGIDIGSVDLVCQLGTTRSIATLLQRVGRARHQRGGLPKGRVFPLTRDELVECTAMLRSLAAGELDALEIPDKPLDVLAQQMVACAATEDWDESRLFQVMKRAMPYRHLDAQEFDDILKMLAEGFSTKRGRRSALVHHDAINHRVRARRGSRLLALTSGGAIPENSDYRVIVEPSETFIGTVNEDFAVESLAGDIFQLGNASWRILRINSGTLRVEDAHGQPPGIPFWLGEAPGRTRELSKSVSNLREQIEQIIQHASDPKAAVSQFLLASSNSHSVTERKPDALAWKQEAAPEETGNLQPVTCNRLQLPTAGAEQLADYFVSGYRSLGLIPSQNKLVLERFFDESGGMQLVIHSPFGIRINRAWGLALRKRFCRSFNFELQAAATDDAIVISLGTQHSFPLEEVFHYLHSNTVRDLLIQALLDAPMFPVRWRWNAGRSLALPRQRGGRKIAAPLQRMEAENLLAAVFPDQLACLENIAGDREIPHHPLVQQTIEDCLTEAMDINGLIGVLKRIESNSIECVARDLPEPSAFAAEIINARVYAFLDDAPLEERRTQAVYTRRAGDSGNNELGILDASAIEAVCEEAWPRAVNSDELHETLLLAGALAAQEAPRVSPETSKWLDALVQEGRVFQFDVTSGNRFWAATERLPLIRSIYPHVRPNDKLLSAEQPERANAIRELVRGRIEISGPITNAALQQLFELSQTEIESALLALEREGFVLRGKFRPSATQTEWCDRRLLARIHRRTITRLRAEIEPVPIVTFLSFLLDWQKLTPEHRAEGLDGLLGVLEQLDGYEIAAGAWEPEVLAVRVNHYSPEWLDQLCFRGSIGWGRLSVPQNQNQRPFAPVRSSPISLFLRENLASWLELSRPASPAEFPSETREVLSALVQRGALFFGELAKLCGLLPSKVEQALAELVAQGWVTSDSFEGLRALLLPQEKRLAFAEKARRRRHKAITSLEFAGRWSLLRPPSSAGQNSPAGTSAGQDAVETFARVLLRRYGVVFRKLLERESVRISWFELGRVFRRLEAQGEIRGGYFVGGVSGEQFALPEAVALLRATRKRAASNQQIVISGADPLNLSGILTPGPKVSAIAANRILFRNGEPIAALEADRISMLNGIPELDPAAERQLRIGSLPPHLRRYYA